MPMAAVMCLVVAVLVIYQYRREADYRTEMMQKELAIINNRILYAYEHDLDMRQFLDFVQQYYTGSLFAGVRVSVYDRDGMLLYSLGTPIARDVEQFKASSRLEQEGTQTRGLIFDEGDPSKVFYYSGIVSEDGQLAVRTSMPYTSEIKDAINIDSNVWLVIAGLLAAVLVVTYYSTRVLTRNISLLKDFAYRVTTGGKFTDLDKFPHNELGDISREIVTMYRERARAFESVERERRVSLHAIEEKARVARQITNNINHEIKTPVAAISGYLETIINTPDISDDARDHFLERMHSHTQRLTSLLADVSVMTRLEEGGERVLVETVDMHDLLYQVDSDLDASHLAGDMRFEYDVPLDCRVRGNFTLLNGMVAGLMRNAAMHSGGSVMGVRLVSQTQRYYVFSFYDNGRGVGQEHLNHLFDRFYRVDTGRSRKMGGTGLGLPIVKSTVLAFGGTISVHNRSTGGLEFIFSLPKADPDGHGH